MSPKSSVSNILEWLLLDWLQPPISKQSAQQSRLCLLFAAIYLIYTKRINPKFATEGECNHIYVSFSMHMLLSDIWSRSNFWVTVHVSWVLKSAKRSIVYQGLTYLQTNQSHFCYKCWLHSLDMTLFEWFWRYLWPKTTFKMSQKFSTVSFGYYPSVFNRHDCGHYGWRWSHWKEGKLAIQQERFLPNDI